MIAEACEVPCCQLCKTEIDAKLDDQCELIKTILYVCLCYMFLLGIALLPFSVFIFVFWDSGTCSCEADNRYEAKCCEKTCG